MKYKLICATSPDQLSTKVETYLNEGWELYGNPVVQELESTSREFFQAVTRPDQ